MKTKHTKVKWVINLSTLGIYNEKYIKVVGADEEDKTFTRGEKIDNIKRIVDCVNACEGIENPKFYIDNLADLNSEKVDLRKQRDELLEACKTLVEILEANNLGLKSQDYLHAIQAIKKGEGK